MNRFNRSILILALAFPAVALAGGNNNQNNSDTINNYGDVNHYTNPTAVGVGIGSANVNNDIDVRNTNTNVNAATNNTDVRNTNVLGVTNSGNNVGGAGGDGGDAVGIGQSNVDVNIAATKTYRPTVSSAIAPTIFPTAPCMGSTSGGVTGTLFSISGGSSWESKQCLILETARSFDQAGYSNDGLHVRCQAEWAKAAPSCQALAKPVTPVAQQPATPVAVKSTDKVTVIKTVAQTATPATSASGYYSVNTNPLAK
jgi:hypothetical protein